MAETKSGLLRAKISVSLSGPGRAHQLPAETMGQVAVLYPFNELTHTNPLNRYLFMSHLRPLPIEVCL